METSSVSTASTTAALFSKYIQSDSWFFYCISNESYRGYRLRLYKIAAREQSEGKKTPKMSSHRHFLDTHSTFHNIFLITYSVWICVVCWFYFVLFFASIWTSSRMWFDLFINFQVQLMIWLYGESIVTVNRVPLIGFVCSFINH